MKRKNFFIALIIFSLIIFVGSAWPDFGNFSGTSDYDYGGSSGSSSSSSGTYGYSYSSNDDETDTDCGEMTIGSIVLASFAFIYYMFKLAWNIIKTAIGWVFGTIYFIFTGKWPESISKEPVTNQPISRQTAPAKKLKPIEKYSALDPNFDEENIKTLMANLFVQMQDAWHVKDISPLRPYMTDAFYNQMERQLEEFRTNHRTDYTERIAVLDVNIKGWRQSGGRDYLTVGLNSRFVSYVLDDVTGKLLSGDRNREKFMEYEIELSRKKGSLTRPEAEGVKSDTCPHCGAPIKLNASAKCEYCGSIITAVNTDWAICSMKGISQRTA